MAYGGPLYTRRERVERLRRQKADFFDRYGLEARAVLNDLLDKYVEHGLAEFDLRDLLRLPPIATRGNLVEIVGALPSVAVNAIWIVIGLVALLRARRRVRTR